MTDCFALLGEPRRPWLDADALKARFLALAATTHPDRVHGASAAERQAAQSRYTELNAAHARLREPKDRLLHLIELESGARPRDVQRLPAGTMDLGLEVGDRCRAVDAFLAERANVTSPLVKVQLFARAQDWTAQLQSLQQRLRAEQETLHAELRRLDANWVSLPPPELPLPRLEEMYRLLSYFARWSAQLQERVVQLAF